VSAGVAFAAWFNIVVYAILTGLWYLIVFTPRLAGDVRWDAYAVLGGAISLAPIARLVGGVGLLYRKEWGLWLCRILPPMAIVCYLAIPVILPIALRLCVPNTPLEHVVSDLSTWMRVYVSFMLPLTACEAALSGYLWSREAVLPLPPEPRRRAVDELPPL